MTEVKDSVLMKALKADKRRFELLRLSNASHLTGGIIEEIANQGDTLIGFAFQNGNLIHPNAFQAIAQLTELKELDLSGCSTATDEALGVVIGKLQNLQRLDLSGTLTSLKTLKQVNWPILRYLRLADCPLPREEAPWLFTLALYQAGELKAFDISGTNWITNNFVSVLLQGSLIPEVKWIGLKRCGITQLSLPDTMTSMFERRLSYPLIIEIEPEMIDVQEWRNNVTKYKREGKWQLSQSVEWRGLSIGKVPLISN